VNITAAGTTLVISDATPEEQTRIIAATKPAPAEPETLSRIETSEIFKVHPGSLKRWEKSGKLRAIKITPRCVRYLKSEVLAILEGNA